MNPFDKTLPIERQKELHLIAYAWHVDTIQFENENKTNLPHVVMSYRGRFESIPIFKIAFEPSKVNFDYPIYEMVIIRAMNLDSEDARNLFRDFRYFEKISKHKEPAIKFPIVIDSLISNCITAKYGQTEFEHLLSSRKNYFKLLEEHLNLIGKEKPWTDAGPIIFYK
jgi:hypothetical protein